MYYCNLKDLISDIMVCSLPKMVEEEHQDDLYRTIYVTMCKAANSIVQSHRVSIPKVAVTSTQVLACMMKLSDFTATCGDTGNSVHRLKQVGFLGRFEIHEDPDIDPGSIILLGEVRPALSIGRMEEVHIARLIKVTGLD